MSINWTSAISDKALEIPLQVKVLCRTDKEGFIFIYINSCADKQIIQIFLEL